MYTSFENPAAPPPIPGRRFQIRPLSTGEILDRALSLYGTTFWFCTGAAALAGMVSLLSGASRVIYLQVTHLSPLTSMFGDVRIALILGFWSIVGMLAYGLSHAALVWGLASVYLGRNASLGAAVAVIRKHWLRYPGVTLIQLLIAGWPLLVSYGLFAGVVFGMRSMGTVAVALGAGVSGLLVLATFPYAIYRYLQLALAMPASVLEGLAIRPALQRSRALLVDRKGRVFVVLLLAAALYFALGTVLSVLTIFGLRGNANLVMTQVITLLLTFTANILLQPLFSAAFTVLYYDERVRREGFDIQLMMSEGQIPAQATVSPASFASSSVSPYPAAFEQGGGYAPVSTASDSGQNYPRV